MTMMGTVITAMMEMTGMAMAVIVTEAIVVAVATETVETGMVVTEIVETVIVTNLESDLMGNLLRV